MQALKQKCRPKHQVLILKCYPRLPKNSSAAEIKPNGSELSYLLYYASSRRSKLTKVGTFLEKRTESDLYKNRTASVQITLLILTAFLNDPGISGAGPQGFGLFAPFVLRILKEVLTKANETVLVEAAVPTWDAFCRHQDHVALSADGEYRALFAEVVKLWAGYATKERGSPKTAARGRMHVGVTDAIKLRAAALQAFRSIADSEALGTEAGRQLDTVVPVVLQNLYGAEVDFGHLLAVQSHNEAQEKEMSLRGRPSMALGRNTTDNGDVRAAEGTAAEGDRLADEEASVLALQCLRSIFAVENRQQTRTATNSVLRFIASQKPYMPTSAEKPTNSPKTKDVWTTKLFETVCNWIPVQDRFVALFTAVEVLIRSPIVEEDLERQLLLSRIVAHVLGSDINLIGLSVMDILLGLLQHVLLILQLGTTSTTLPGSGDFTSSDEDLKSRASGEKPQQLIMEVSRKPSPSRVQLLGQLQQCIANLAVHVYYTDQISDMVSAILLRLKPSLAAAHNPSVTAAAIENPEIAAAEVATQTSLRERPNTDGFFSFDTAREVALGAVKDIILVANSSQSDSSYVANNRNLVPISVWEGTQWLLRDTCADVRRVYVDALCVWLKLELRQSSFRLQEESASSERKGNKDGGGLASRAASNASARHRGVKRSRSTFLQLLHLAIYENALEYAEATNGEADLLLLHLLTTSLSRHLGLNAVRIGLPMVFRLQEDIDGLGPSFAKVRVGSLVYGYVWALIEIFDLDDVQLARHVHAEIARRRDVKLWVSGIRMPPVPADEVLTAVIRPLERPALTSGMMNPFEHRSELIEHLETSYSATQSTPPPSAPASPSRSFSLPVLGPDFPTTSLTSGDERKLPSSTIKELSSSWSRDELLATLAANAPKSSSLSGSRTGVNMARSPGPNVGMNGNNYFAINANNHLLKGDHRHLLAAANSYPLSRSRTRSREGSPRTSGGLDAERQPSYAPSAASGGARHRLRSHSRTKGGLARANSSSRSPGSGNDRRRISEAGSRRAGSGLTGASRVEELKRVLASGGSGPAGLGFAAGRGRDDGFDDADDTNSDSLVDIDESVGTFGDGDGDEDRDIGNEDSRSASDSSAEGQTFDTQPITQASQEREQAQHRQQTFATASPTHTYPVAEDSTEIYTLTGDPSDSAVIDAALAYTGPSHTIPDFTDDSFASPSQPQTESKTTTGTKNDTLAPPAPTTPLLRLNSDDMPPTPGLPGTKASTTSNAPGPSSINTAHQTTATEDFAAASASASPSSGSGPSSRTGFAFGSEPAASNRSRSKSPGASVRPKRDLGALLRGIDVGGSEGGEGLGRPPY